MGDLFRSEEMNLIQIFIQPEAAYHVVAELGEKGCVQFIDLNEPVNLFQRTYATEVKRANEMERQLKYVENEIKRSDIRIHDISVLPKAPNPREIVNLEAHLEKTEREIKELEEGAMHLKKEYNEKVNHKYVLTKAQLFFNQQEEAIQSDYTPEDIKNASQLGFVAGVINKEKLASFERVLWRIGRGTIFLRHSDVEELIFDSSTGKEVRKSAFIVFFQGENLAQKIHKICNGFKVYIVDLPVEHSVRDEQIKKISVEILDIKNVLNQMEEHKKRLLVSVAKDIQDWSIIVCKIKAIYNTMNLFSLDVTKKCLIAEGWVPTNDLQFIRAALQDGSAACNSTVPSFFNTLNTNITPPTFNRTNKFTKGFQNLIEAYAVSSYRELNPALYTIVTFPFLFAIMFGDLGHGIIMLVFALWMVLSEKKIAAQKDKDEIFVIFFGGRYIILLMGIFSIYTGFIYNDLFSKSMNIFGSKWIVSENSTNCSLYTILDNNNLNSTVISSSSLFQIRPIDCFEGNPYFAGLDPAWQSADNKIIFLNSLKMKLSIIFGVVHMVFGVCLSIVNFLQFKKPAYIFLDFLPKILFFAFLFVYLLVMIFMKWLNYSAMKDNGEDIPHGSSCAPNVLIYFIGMMLFKKSEIEKPCDAYMYSGQQSMQKVLLIMALICIPWMLLGAPLYEILFRRKPKVNIQQNGHAGNHIELEVIPEDAELVTEHEESISDIMVHAGIHTIEFTLSTVSHTASYLRLWALSLAHAQLSDVLWEMVFKKALVTLSKPYIGSVYIYIIFGAWSVTTVGILVMMEGLSAFLHTLRLHWVEFMTKFFEGQGIAFTPFSFERIFEEQEEAAAN